MTTTEKQELVTLIESKIKEYQGTSNLLKVIGHPNTGYGQGAVDALTDVLQSLQK